ncbi:MAG: TonB-dependent receptor [Paludibacteraceae bacterium]|nr:TonB-dependent receptor [Paludibacteraceae bacterium]
MKLNFSVFRTMAMSVLLLLGMAAQARVISGTVKDQTGETIISASVVVKGTSIGTVTDFDGNYSLDVPDDAKVLVFSYIGMKTQELNITGSVMNVVLSENSEVLEEVVVTGYGTTKKRDVVTSVASVNADQLKDIPVASASEALQGKLAGVSVTTTEGSPDADVKIRVRGGTSLTQSNDPLYIVDGFPVSSISDIAPSDIASMDVLKDAAATAIYGAQGANGVIIITTKDSNSEDDKMTFHVDYSGYVGWKKIAKKYDVLDPKDFMMTQYEWAYYKDKTKLKSNFNAYFDALYNRTKHRADEEQETTGITDLIAEYSDPAQHECIDWQDRTFGRTGFNSNHSVSVSGGNKNANFNLSYNRVDDKAIMYMSNYVRNNLSLKAKFKPFKNFTLGFTARYTNTQVLGAGSNAIKDNGTSSESRLRNAVVYTPTTLLSKNTEGASEEDETVGSLVDPITAILDNYKFKKDDKWTINGYASYKFAKYFTIRTELGYDSRKINTDRYYGPTTYFARNTGRPGVAAGTAQLQVLGENESRLRNANTFEWKQSFVDNSHNVSVLLGEETIIHKSETKTMNGFGYKGNYNEETGEIFNYLGQASYSEILNYIAPKDNQLSFFARANYDYKGRYYLTATFRADCSTRFEKENQWGFFPSVAAAWRMSDEEWMQGASSWLSNMKFRLSYGMAGNNNVDLGYLHRDFLSSQMTYLDMGNGASNILVLGGSDKIAPNPHLKWETTITRDFGIDYGFFNERLTGTIDLYWNTTKDLIIRQTLPARYNYQYQNIGSTRNMGVEFSVKGVILDRKSKSLSYNLTVDGNIAYNRNKVMSLGDGIKSISAQTGCFGSSEYMTLAEFLVEVGQPIGNVWGYQTDGYYTASDFARYNVTTNTWIRNEGVPKYADGFLSNDVMPGAIKFVDQNGDGSIDEQDKVLLGNTVPVLTGGFGLNFNIGGDKWGRVDVGANFTFSWGNKILNLNKMEYTTVTDKSRLRNLISDVSFQNRYSMFDENGINFIDNPEYLNPADLRSMAGNQYLTGNAYNTFAQRVDEYNAAKGAKHNSPVMSHYIVTDQCMEDGSFLRLNQLTIGYSFPKVWMEKTKVINNIRVYVQGSNLFCATKYTGMDPEVDTRSSKNPLTPGVDFSAYPKSRGINVGLNVQF